MIRAAVLREQKRRDEAKEQREALEGNLDQFVEQSWSVLEPGRKMLWNWHLQLICEYLELARRREITRLIINVPPRTMKSTLITVNWPVWWWATEPETRFMFVSYDDSLATDHSVYRRNIINSDFYQNHWGKVFKFSKDQNLKTQYENSKQGRMFATSITGSGTGKGGDVLVIDDPQNPKKAFSDAERETVNKNFDATFRTRLNDQENGVIVIVMQRLHESDLTGHVLAQEPGVWKHVKLPAIAEKDERLEFPISHEVVERKAGDLLWSKRLPKKALDRLQIGMGSWAFAGQYQQNPAPLEGGLIKIAWASNFYRELPERFDLMVQSWDCTFKDSDGSDFVAGQVWGKSGGKYYMMPYRTYARLDFGPTMAAIKSCHAAFPKAHAILIEDKANGSAIISELQKEISGIVAINPEGGKMTRAQGTSPIWESGSILLPDPQKFDVPWLAEYQHNICTFPKAAHDDDMDATSQALIYIRHKMGGGIMDFYRKGAEQIKVQENISRGLPPKKGARVVETRLTQTVKNWAANPGSTFLCSKSQYPEVRQAMLDLNTEAALREVARLDEIHDWRTT